MDPCQDQNGNDTCHLARAAPKVDFSTQQARKSMKGTQPNKMRDRALRLTGSPLDEASMAMVRAAIQLISAPLAGTQRERTEQQVNAIRVRLPQMRPKLSSIPAEVMDRARMVRASTEAFKHGMGAAQEFVDRHPSMRGWKVDTQLSDRSSLVLERNGDIKVAYRGTQWSNAPDVVHNGQAFVFTEGFSQQMADARAQMRGVRAKYGVLPSELLGYSRGGGMAMHLGDEFGIRTTSFNPFVSPKQLATPSKVPHSIFRTTEDPVSSLLAFARHKTNYSVSAIHPIRGLNDPKSMHSLKHFTSAGARQPGGMEVLMRQGIEKGQQLAHLETLDAMATGVEQGKTFTQALDDFNRTQGARQTVDVTESGRLGPRIHRQSGTVRYWEAAGGTFTDVEQQHLASNPSPPERTISPEAAAMGVSHDPLTPSQTDHVAGLGSEERAAFMAARRADLQSHHELMNQTARPHEEVIRGLMPRTSSLATGVVSGFAAHALMEGIDPEHRLHPVASEGVEGAVSGAMGAGMMTALGGSAALGPEVLAGASAYIAGAESQRAITDALTRGGMDREGAEAVGGVSGGAIGGVTATATGMGAMIASDLLFGTTLGTAIGGPVGAAIGAGVGVTIGAVTGAVGYLFGRAGRDEQRQEQRDDAYSQLVEEQSTAGVEATIQVPNPTLSNVSHTPLVSRTMGDEHVAAGMIGAGPMAQAQHMNSILTGAPPPPRRYVPPVVGQNDAPPGTTIHF